MASHGPKAKNTELLVAMRLASPQEWFERVVAALTGSHGDVARAAEGLGTHPRTLYRWIHDDKTLQSIQRRLRSAA